MKLKMHQTYIKLTPNEELKTPKQQIFQNTSNPKQKHNFDLKKMNTVDLKHTMAAADLMSSGEDETMEERLVYVM